MKISCNILKKHLKNSEKIDFLKIWNTFTIRTAEVEDVSIMGNDFESVVTAKIISCEKHPKSEKLHVLKIDNGKEELQVVCGAPNVRVGLISALVMVGGRIGDITISPRPLVGIESFGMMCSGQELGISSNHDGIIELPEDTEIGVDIKSVLPIEDIIVEIDNKSLTNRPDLWGHYGIAREIAAITGNELLPLDLSSLEEGKEEVNIKIINPENCYRYIGTKLDNINNTKTPLWMQIFLHYVGMRSISLIVDLTNYVMLELGQPMHAFDSRTVKDIEIGLAKAGDKFETLDGITRTLTDKDLMIKNGGEYFAVAGVMGGLSSEIVADTSSIILESATFEASGVRKTATSLGLRTEASSRYEKSLDPNLAYDATKRFIKLLSDENPELVMGTKITDIYPNQFKEIDVTLSKALLNKYMGFILEDEIVIKILESLSFKVKAKKEVFIVTVPTFRATKDVTIGADLIEEIARIYGYENIPVKPLRMDLTFDTPDLIYENAYELKDYLAIKYNLHEIHTYLWNKTDFLKDLGISLDNVKLLGKNEDNILREELSLSMLEASLSNVKNNDEFGLFEIGTIIVNNESKKALSIMLVKNNDDIKKAYNEVKEIAVNIFKNLKNTTPVFEFGEAPDYYNNDLTQNIIINGLVIGQIKVFNKTVSNKISKKRCFVALEIDFDLYNGIESKKNLYQEVSKFPVTVLDYTVLTKRGEYYQKLEQILGGFSSPIILNYKLMDIYLDDEVKKVTIRYTVGSFEKTLTSEELQNFKDEFIKFLKNHDLSIIEE